MPPSGGLAHGRGRRPACACGTHHRASAGGAAEDGACSHAGMGGRAHWSRLTDHLLLEGRQHRHNGWVRAGEAHLFDVVDLDLLLREHAAVHGDGHEMNTMLDALWNITAGALTDAEHQRRKAGHPQDAIVASGVLPVKARLDQETIARDRQTCTAASLSPCTVAVLRVPERTAREHAPAADVILAEDVDDLEALLPGHAAHAAAAEEAGQRGLAGRLEQSDLPLAGQLLGDFLLERHRFLQVPPEGGVTVDE
mmetsp:Transcript_167083/g.536568  ORF Transcript_167083/g.536568 Transcript_167083/m.536568 type:complete len:253 (+) Transcript_167083:598-1356(+)